MPSQRLARDQIIDFTIWFEQIYGSWCKAWISLGAVPKNQSYFSSYISKLLVYILIINKSKLDKSIGFSFRSARVDTAFDPMSETKPLQFPLQYISHYPRFPSLSSLSLPPFLSFSLSTDYYELCRTRLQKNQDIIFCTSIPLNVRNFFAQHVLKTPKSMRDSYSNNTWFTCRFIL